MHSVQQISVDVNKIETFALFELEEKNFTGYEDLENSRLIVYIILPVIEYKFINDEIILYFYTPYHEKLIISFQEAEKKFGKCLCLIPQSDLSKVRESVKSQFIMHKEGIDKDGIVDCDTVTHFYDYPHSAYHYENKDNIFSVRIWRKYK